MKTIAVENVSKRYYFGERPPYSVREMIRAMFRFSNKTSEVRDLWALKDVSFEANVGDTLGFIGNNGAGKSTLLKILSRITKPTSGTAEIFGRVGSLLEVGTGFHNELSGRENIYLNGAILGMKRVEIETKFDEIVEFSEIAKFLDTPVKHYSSGMYTRLAFAIAAHLEPEVLIVDEVLAVGDVGFQKKCLNKMRDVGRSGRTVIFVSHDMHAIARLCNRVIWLKDGEIVNDGPAKTIISDYLHEQTKTGSERFWDEHEAPGSSSLRLRRVRVVNGGNETVSTSEIGAVVGVEMTYEVLDEAKVFVPSFQFHNEQGVCILISHDWSAEWRERRRPKGTYTSTVWVPENFLAEGPVFVSAGIAGHRPLETHVAERDVVTFNVVDSTNDGAARGDFVGIMPGVIRPVLEWKTQVKTIQS